VGKVTGNGILFFHFSGHGTQVGCRIAVAEALIFCIVHLTVSIVLESDYTITLVATSCNHAMDEHLPSLRTTLCVGWVQVPNDPGDMHDKTEADGKDEAIVPTDMNVGEQTLFFTAHSPIHSSMMWTTANSFGRQQMLHLSP
jgi:hypothetical protein